MLLYRSTDYGAILHLIRLAEPHSFCYGALLHLIRLAEPHSIVYGAFLHIIKIKRRQEHLVTSSYTIYYELSSIGMPALLVLFSEWFLSFCIRKGTNGILSFPLNRSRHIRLAHHWTVRDIRSSHDGTMRYIRSIR